MVYTSTHLHIYTSTHLHIGSLVAPVPTLADAVQLASSAAAPAMNTTAGQVPVIVSVSVSICVYVRVTVYVRVSVHAAPLVLHLHGVGRPGYGLMQASVCVCVSDRPLDPVHRIASHRMY